MRTSDKRDGQRKEKPGKDKTRGNKSNRKTQNTGEGEQGEKTDEKGTKTGNNEVRWKKKSQQRV